MEYNGQERRREPRYPRKAKAVVLRQKDKGEAMPAEVVNISTGGLLLEVQDVEQTLRVGDEVMCDVDLPTEPGMAFPTWGVGKVVRVEGTRAGIELKAASFNPKE